MFPIIIRALLVIVAVAYVYYEVSKCWRKTDLTEEGINEVEEARIKSQEVINRSKKLSDIDFEKADKAKQNIKKIRTRRK